MANIDRRWEDLQEKWERAKEQTAKAEGALAATVSQLKKEFGVTDPADIEKMLGTMAIERDEIEKELQELLDKLEAVLTNKGDE